MCCSECSSHFKNLRSHISGYKISKHLAKELEDHQEIIPKILACETECFSELHKFEEKIGGIYIFRAKIDKVHIVYAVDTKTVLFLRAFKNFNDYTRFLEDKKGIIKLINSM